jgi:hypothetical protein
MAARKTPKKKPTITKGRRWSDPTKPPSYWNSKDGKYKGKRKNDMC